MRFSAFRLGKPAKKEKINIFKLISPRSAEVQKPEYLEDRRPTRLLSATCPGFGYGG